MLRFLLPVFIAMLAAAPAESRSNAAKWLIGQEIAEACMSGRGTIDAASAIERDLTGDGRADLVLAHEGIACEGGMARSIFCGAQVCTVKIYVRRGDLLELEVDMLGGGVRVEGDPPVIHMHAHGGAPGTLRWDGGRFR